MPAMYKAKITKEFPTDASLPYKVGEVWEITNSFPPVYFVHNPDTGRDGVLVSGEFDLIVPEGYERDAASYAE